MSRDPTILNRPTLDLHDPEHRFHGDPMEVAYYSGQLWKILRELSYESRLGRTTVRKGFIFDFGSIPRFAWSWLMPPTGDRRNPAGYAFVFHDWLYVHQMIAGRTITREAADAILYEILLYVGCSKWKSRLTLWGVRLGGWVPWNRNAKKNRETSNALDDRIDRGTDNPLPS